MKDPGFLQLALFFWHPCVSSVLLFPFFRRQNIVCPMEEVASN